MDKLSTPAGAAPKPQTPAQPSPAPTFSSRHKRHNTSVSSKDRVKLFLDLGSLPPQTPSHRREPSQEFDPDMSRGAETQFKQMQDQTPDRLMELHRCHVAGPADGVAVRDFATHVKVPPPKMDDIRKGVTQRRKEWKDVQKRNAKRRDSRANQRGDGSEAENAQTTGLSRNGESSGRRSSLPDFLASVWGSLKRS